jgi:hypothetical protein
MARKKPQKTPKNPQPAREREPWTPWGKWAKRRRERIEQRRTEREQRRIARQKRRRLRQLRRRQVTARGVGFLLMILFACAIGVLVLVLLGRPYPWESFRDVNAVLATTDELAANRDRWQSLAVTHYTVEVEYVSSATRCGPVRIEVLDGQIQGDPSADATFWSPPAVCDDQLDRLVIDGAFTWLRSALIDFLPGSTRLQITFDDSFGYPTHAESDVYDPDDAIDGCCWRADWRDVQPIVPRD